MFLLLSSSSLAQKPLACFSLELLGKSTLYCAAYGEHNATDKEKLQYCQSASSLLSTVIILKYYHTVSTFILEAHFVCFT